MTSTIAKTALAAAFAVLCVSLPATPAEAGPSKEEKARKKFEKKFREVTQPIQYDGEYSPPVGRPPEPEPSATVPVRYIPPYMREIPVVVPPRPVYLTQDQFDQQEQNRAREIQQREAQRAQAAANSGAGSFAPGNLQSNQQPFQNGLQNSNGDEYAEQEVPGQVYEGDGSVTGSDTYADFSKPLPE